MGNILNFHSFNENKNDDKKSFLLIFRKNIKDGKLEILIDNEADSLAGGRCDKKETYEEGLLRELDEETGKKFKLDDITFLEKIKNVKYYYIFIDDSVSKELKPNSDFKNGEWCKIEKVKSKLIMKLIHKSILDKVSDLSVNENNNYDKIVSDILTKPNSKKNGILIVFEGIDGAGKSTQVELLQEYLKKLNYEIEYTKWSSCEYLKKSMKTLKSEKLLDNISYFLLNASDMNLRYVNDILPALQENKIVICDRYFYTSLVRDTLRGIDDKIITGLFKDYLTPDVIFYCKVPIDVAFGRLVNNKGFSYYGSGMDLKYSLSVEENCIKYQNEMQKKYNSLFKNLDNVSVLNMTKNPHEIFDDIKSVLYKDFGIGKY
jgi:dTMP kinase